MPNRTCLRCGHHWEPRFRRRSKFCPKCKSPYWDKPYTERTRRIADRVKEARGGYS